MNGGGQSRQREEHKAVCRNKDGHCQMTSLKGWPGEQRGSLTQSCKGFENRWIRGRGGLNVMRESEVKGIDDQRVREDGSVCVIGSGI